MALPPTTSTLVAAVARGKMAAPCKAASVRALSVGASPEQQRHPKLSASELDSQASIAALKKGPGYRSSCSGMVATVFGASGLVGRGVVNRLGKSGSQMILPYRGDHYRYMRFKTAGDLGQVLFTPYNLRDEESIRRSMSYSNVVFNLIGREYVTRNFNFRDVNVEGPRRLARIARESGVKKFVHISHINAREEPERIWSLKGSEFLRTKWEGEKAVLEEFPDAIIFRPTEMYGPNDVFIHHIFTWGRFGFQHRFPMWNKGMETVKIPLSFSDLVSGIMNSLDDPMAPGTTYEAYGPDRFRMYDLISWIAESTNRDPYDFRFKITDMRFSPYVFAKALLFQNLPFGNRYMGTHTIERLERTALSEEILGLPNLRDLGVEAAPVTEKMRKEMWPLRAYAHYVPDNFAEMPDPDPPTPLDDYDYKQALKRGKTSLVQQFGLVA